MLPIAILAWAIFSLKLLVDAGSTPLLGLYAAYLGYMLAVALLCRKNILQPVGVSMLIGFLAFGSNIPLFANGLIGDIRPIKTNLLFNVHGVFFLSQIMFALGTLFKIDPRFSPARMLLYSKFKPVNIGFGLLILITLFVAVAGAFRIRFNIGAAKALSSFPFSGIFHYALLDGLLMVLLWCLAASLKRKNISYTVFSGVPLLGLVLTQAFLGWRGMIFRVMVCVVVVFWYQKRLYQNEKVRSFAWLALLAGIGFFSIQLGHERRAVTTGADKEFSLNPLHFIEKVQVRSQGTTRLAAVLERFDNNPYTNDWFFLELRRQRETATSYVNRVVYGIRRHQKHSVGCSGPGTVYISGGLIGVAIVYFLWGTFYGSVYKEIGFEKNISPNLLAIALYATLIDSLIYTNAESFGIGVLKKLAAVIAIAYFCRKFVISSKQRTRRSTLPAMMLHEPRIGAR